MFYDLVLLCRIYRQDAKSQSLKEKNFVTSRFGDFVVGFQPEEIL